MDFAALYHFLFETMPGIGCLVLVFLIASTLVAAILERRTRKTFKDRGNVKDDDWKFEEEEETKCRRPFCMIGKPIPTISPE